MREEDRPFIKFEKPDLSSMPVGWSHISDAASGKSVFLHSKSSSIAFGMDEVLRMEAFLNSNTSRMLDLTQDSDDSTKSNKRKKGEGNLKDDDDYKTDSDEETEVQGFNKKNK